MTAGLFVCRDPRSPHWQLGELPPARGHVALLGWSIQPSPVNAGVPDDVALVLASAFVAYGRVTFLSSTGAAAAKSAAWAPSGLDMAARVDKRRMLVSTRRAERARELFDDAKHPWWMQGQFALISEALPPEPDPKTVSALLSDEWMSTAAAEAVLRPGVDGDVAGLWCAEAALLDRLVADLGAEALSEAAFADRLSSLRG